METVQRKRVSRFELRGPDPYEIKILRTRLRRVAGGKMFVYRESPTSGEIVVANHDVEGRRDLLAVYDRNVTTAMLRQDLYHEDAEDIRWANWGGAS